MQNPKPIQTTQSQEEPATDAQTTLPAWMPPKIKVYEEEELLKAVPALGCQLQAALPPIGF